MTARVHIHLRVSDLERSRDFYQKFFGAGPVKERPGYVKFLPDFAPVNLALSNGASERGHRAPVNHLGVQVDSTETVMAHLTRVKAAGLPVREEMGVDCCHANQDKFWVRDPDGVEWEVYHLNYNYDLEDEEDLVRPAKGGKEIPVMVVAPTNACCGPAVRPRQWR